MKYWDGVGPGRPTEAVPQLEAVLGEVRRLEEAATRNEEELEREAGPGGGPGIRGELDQLKHRLGEIGVTGEREKCVNDCCCRND